MERQISVAVKVDQFQWWSRIIWSEETGTHTDLYI